MQQQINLFQPVFRREEKVFSARTLAQILVIALVLLVGGIALLQLQLAKLASTRDMLAGQNRGLESKLQLLEAQADTRPLKALDDRIVELETRLEDGDSELNEISGLMLERSTGFATVLDALARHPQNGLWLTAIRVRAGELELQGRTIDPELIPAYLEQLADDATLSQWSLSTVRLERDPELPEQLSFTLRSNSTWGDS